MTGDSEFVFAALGGLGEIGMNCALYGYGPPKARKWLMVDLGVAFAGEDLPGVDLIMPAVDFIEKAKKDLVGLIITHAHEDHIGALADLWPSLGPPVYATSFAAGLAEARRLGEPGAPRIPLQVVKQGERAAIDPFDVEFIGVAHSIPESCALAIRTPAGLVVHSADWKIDPTPVIGLPTDEARLRALGDEGVLALVCNSTNVLREGESPSEREVAETLASLIAKAKGRVVVTTFASNVARLRSAAEAGFAVGRQVCILGRAMERVVAVARECRMLDGVPQFLGMDAFERLASRQDSGARHRQPGRAARGACPHGGRRASDRGAEPGRHRDLLVAHHPGQREGGRQARQRLCDRWRRSRHRPERAGACLRPSAPGGAGENVCLAPAQDRRARAWRAAAPQRARRLRQGARRPAGAARLQRRPGALGARRCLDDRQGRPRPAAEGRRRFFCRPTRNASANGAGSPSPASSRSRSR